MATVHVLKPFSDFVEKVDRTEGEDFEATDERADYIAAKLPGYVTVTKDPQPQSEVEGSPNLAALKVAQLKALCAERGIEVPKRATKARLIAILEG